MHYGLNRLKKSKMGENRKNRMKSRKIAILGPILRLCQNDALKQNSPHGPAVRRLLAVEMHSHDSRDCLQSSQITKYSFFFPTEQIPNPLI